MSYNSPSGKDDLADLKNYVKSKQELAPGTTLNQRYVIQEKLGKGGMGQVYKAQDRKHQRIVAVKQLLTKAGKENQELVERFKREYYFLSAINHPSLVKAYDFFKEGSSHFLVLEFVTGISLLELIQQRPFSLPIRDQVAIASQISQAIETLNTAGILHRDIKPANIMINPKNKAVKLLDLGLGKSIGGDELELTKPGVVLGTAEYLSPEQANGTISARSDVFSLAVTLYQFFLWEEKSPFYTGHKISTMMSVLTKELPNLREALDNAYEGKTNQRKERECLQEEMTSILEKALKKEPVDRLEDSLEIVHSLSKCYNKLVEMQSPGNWSLISPPAIDKQDLKKLGEKYGRDVSDQSLPTVETVSESPNRKTRRTASTRRGTAVPEDKMEIILYITIGIVFLAIAVVTIILIRG